MENTSQQEVLERTRQYVRENFTYMRPDFELRDDQGLMDAGVIDSMGVMELLEFIQDEYGVMVEDDEITEQNLGTLDAISKYVVSKQNGTLATT